MNQNMNCPTFNWRTQYDNEQQKLWCPIANGPIVDAKGQVLGRSTDLMAVFTGGDMRSLNPVTIEGYATNASNFRYISQLNQSMSNPICMTGNCPPPSKPTSAPVTKAPVKESYCGCTSSHVARSGINMMPTY